jgi:P2-related tail formation protein
MSSVAAVLPPSPTAWENACAQAMSDDLPVPIAQIVDPTQTPEAFLPWLAAHESVDLWFPDWTDDRKRAVIENAWTDAALKGTRQGAVNFLSYVGGTLVDAIAYPARFVMGQAVLGRTPIDHPPFVARYLVNVATNEPPNCFVLGRAAVGVAAVTTPDPTPINRCLTAMRVARAPETQIRASFASQRQLAIEDAPPLDGSAYLGQWIPNTSL